MSRRTSQASSDAPSLQVKVSRLFHLTPKSGQLVLRCEFAGKAGPDVYPEQPLDAIPEDAEPSQQQPKAESEGLICNYQADFPLSDASTDIELAELIANTPLTIRVLEAVKEKKKKSETLVPVATATVDLSPFVTGRSSLDLDAPLVANAPGSAPGATTPMSPAGARGGAVNNTGPDRSSEQPMAQVRVTVSRPLVDVSEGQGCLITMDVLGVYSLPDPVAASAQSGAGATFSLKLHDVPNWPIGDRALSLAEGSVQPAPATATAEGSEAWSALGDLQPRPKDATESVVDVNDIHTFLGGQGEQDSSQPDEQWRQACETQKSFIRWTDSRQRAYLNRSGRERLKAQIAKDKMFRFELQRSTAAVSTKAKSRAANVEDLEPLCVSAYIDATPLLYPGTSRICGGAWLCRPCPVAEESDRHPSMTEEKPSSAGSRSKKAKEKRGPSSLQHQQTAAASPRGTSHSAINPLDTIRQFDQAMTYVVFSLELDSPLVQKRDPEADNKQLADIIPPRETEPSAVELSEQAHAHFEAEVAAASKIVLKHLRELLEDPEHSGRSLDDLQDELMFHLQSRGVVETLRSALGDASMRVAREAFAVPAQDSSEASKHDFVSRLFMHLAKKAQNGIDRALSAPETARVPVNVGPADLVQWAQEAESVGDASHSLRFLQNAVSMDSTSARLWQRLGDFFFRQGDLAKAEEAYHEGVACLQAAKQQNSPEGCLLLAVAGVIASASNRPDQACQLMEAATASQDAGLLPWLLRGLVCQQAGDEIHAIMCLRKAQEIEKASRDIASQTHPAVTDSLDEPLSNHAQHAKPNHMFLVAAKQLIDIGAVALADAALVHEKTLLGESFEFSVQRARLSALMTGKVEDQTLASLQQYEHSHFEDGQFWTALGDCAWAEGNTDKALAAYKRVHEMQSHGSELIAPLLRLGTLLLNDGQYEEAKGVFLRLCVHHPSPLAWRGLGEACLRMDQLQDAEDALAEANVLDNADARTRALLCMLCLKCGRNEEAQQSFKFALRQGLDTDSSLCDEIKDLDTGRSLIAV